MHPRQGTAPRMPGGRRRPQHRRHLAPYRKSRAADAIDGGLKHLATRNGFLRAYWEATDTCSGPATSRAKAEEFSVPSEAASSQSSPPRTLCTREEIYFA